MTPDPYRDVARAGLAALVESTPPGPDWDELESAKTLSPPRRKTPGWIAGVATGLVVLVALGTLALLRPTGQTPLTSAPRAILTTATTVITPQVTPIDPGLLAPRFGHSVVWSGTEMIVWGGNTASDVHSMFDDGAAFDPASGLWRPIADSPVFGMTSHFAAWTGDEMVIVGKAGAAAYDPTSDSWRVLPDPPMQIHQIGDFPSVTKYAWSGRYVYAWNPGSRLNPDSESMARLDSATGSWEEMEPPGLVADPAKLLARDDRLLAFGTRWPGGVPDPNDSYTLFSFELVNGEWEQLPPIDFVTDMNANVADPGSATFTGDDVIVWGDGGLDSGDARILHPDHTWSAVPHPPIDANLLHPEPIALSDGRVLALSEGGRAAIWEPSAGDWTQLATIPVTSGREAVWTGSEIITWSSGAGWRWAPPPSTG